MKGMPSHVKCTDCGQDKEPVAQITVNDVTQCFCADCWEARRAGFMAKLQQGDPRAQSLLALVLGVAARTGRPK